MAAEANQGPKAVLLISAALKPLLPRASLKENLLKLYKFRDFAVHPDAVMEAPALYSELSILTEWRVVAFRSENARLFVQLALKLIARNVLRPRIKYSELVTLCDNCKGFITPLQETWEAKRGSLSVYPSGENDSQSDPVSLPPLATNEGVDA